jgi:hypothetical protein
MTGSLFLKQNTKDLVRKFGVDGKNHIRTPISVSVKFTVGLSGKSADQTLYCNMIISLLYPTASRPDISFSVGVCARFQANPKELHLTVVKRIIRYVNVIVNHGIWYSRDTDLNLASYSDSDWAGSADDRKEYFGRLLLCGNKPYGMAEET